MRVLRISGHCGRSWKESISVPLLLWSVDQRGDICDAQYCMRYIYWTDRDLSNWFYIAYSHVLYYCTSGLYDEKFNNLTQYVGRLVFFSSSYLLFLIRLHLTLKHKIAKRVHNVFRVIYNFRTHYVHRSWIIYKFHFSIKSPCAAVLLKKNKTQRWFPGGRVQSEQDIISWTFRAWKLFIVLISLSQSDLLIIALSQIPSESTTLICRIGSAYLHHSPKESREHKSKKEKAMMSFGKIAPKTKLNLYTIDHALCDAVLWTSEFRSQVQDREISRLTLNFLTFPSK